MEGEAGKGGGDEGHEVEQHELWNISEQMLQIQALKYFPLYGTLNCEWVNQGGMS